MTEEERNPLTIPSDISLTTKSDSESVQLVGLAIALRDLAQRLSSLEEKLPPASSGSKRGFAFIEFSKVLFGGWPALGFLFLLLFYSPLKEALNAIPAKVKAAQEIVLPGVSLKSSIQAEAKRLGENNLSETIPRLSSAAIELLLRAPKEPDSLISYTPDELQAFTEIHFPSPSVIDAMSELQRQGLIDIQSETGHLTGADTRKLIEDFYSKYPGREERSFIEGRVTWKPNTPLPRNTQFPMLTWELTELGKKAVEVILNAVSTELAPKATASSTQWPWLAETALYRSSGGA